MTHHFNNQVVLVTGSTRGLGRDFARAFAGLGAQVVINGTKPPDPPETADEIRALGGKVLEIYEPVTEADRIISTIIDTCGRLDAIVHNAGFVRDAAFKNMTQEQWDDVYRVHLEAAFRLSRAVWPHFMQQNHGKLLFISSTAGMFGNFGQANYSAAKMGLYGLCRTLAIEGAKYNIHSNCVCPLGITDMNREIMDSGLHDAFRPEYVSPIVNWLCHPECQETGGLYEAFGGWFAKLDWARSQGVQFKGEQLGDLQALVENWDQVSDMTASDFPENIQESIRNFIKRQS